VRWRSSCRGTGTGRSSRKSPKLRQRRLTRVDEIVLSLYAKGLTTGESSAHFAEIYGASVLKEMVSRITDKVVEEMTDWANRPLQGGQFLVNVANHRWLLVACPSLHGLVRCLVGEAQPRPVVEFCSDEVELVGGPTAEVGSFRQILAQ
jgi:hypothetical protein